MTMLDLRSMGNSPLACSLPACGRALSLSSEPIPCCQRPGVPGDQACVDEPVTRRSLCKLHCFGRITAVILMTLRGHSILKTLPPSMSYFLHIALIAVKTKFTARSIFIWSIREGSNLHSHPLPLSTFVASGDTYAYLALYTRLELAFSDRQSEAFT